MLTDFGCAKEWRDADGERHAVGLHRVPGRGRDAEVLGHAAGLPPLHEAVVRRERVGHAHGHGHKQLVTRTVSIPVPVLVSV